MTATPPTWAVDEALRIAAGSPCRSKRGVVVYNVNGRCLGSGYNGPPEPFVCPGRDLCSGTCGKRCVHAEMRALRGIELMMLSGMLDLVHVELAADGGVVACDGPSCWQCSREIMDVGFVAGVWLYLGLSRCLVCRLFEDGSRERLQRCPECGSGLTDAGVWRRYTAEEFHRATLERCGMVP